MATARAYWKGYLKLSLVSCPIALYTGTSSSERVSFRQIHKKTGNRLRQQLVDEITRETVETEDKGRGYEYAKNVYIPVADDELDAIAIESNHTIEISSFVPRNQIDERYLDSTYYIAPSEQVAQEAFAVIREAMRGKGMAALGRVVLARRERIIMLEAWDRGLVGTTLRYPYEVRDTNEYFNSIPNVELDPEMLHLAKHIFRAPRARESDRAGERGPFSVSLQRLPCWPPLRSASGASNPVSALQRRGCCRHRPRSSAAPDRLAPPQLAKMESPTAPRAETAAGSRGAGRAIATPCPCSARARV